MTMPDPTARDGEIIRLRNRTRALEAELAEARAAIEAHEAHIDSIYEIDRRAMQMTREQRDKAQAERDALKATVEKLSARHQPQTVTQVLRCDRHSKAWSGNLEMFQDCPACRTEPITACSNITCCDWPCDDARAIAAVLYAPESPAPARTPVTAATEAHDGAGEAQEGSQWAR